MKNELTLKNLFMLAALIYFAVRFEINSQREYTGSQFDKKHEKSKEVLREKLYDYEVNRLKERSFVDNATNEQLDSLESMPKPQISIRRRL